MVDIPCSLILTAKNIHCSREVNDHVLSCFPWEAVLHFINGSTGCLCNWSKSIRGGGGAWAGEEREWVISVSDLCKGWVVKFSASHGGWSSGFITGIGTINNRGNSFQFQRTKIFDPTVAEKVHLAGVL